MEDLRVPTVPLSVEIRYFDERPLLGRIFIPGLSDSHEGPMRPDEWINQATTFFPFAPDDAKHAQLLNKRYVVVLTVDDAEEPEQADPSYMRRVIVECGTVRLEGQVDVAMPDNQRRVLDLMNRPDLFLTLRNGSRTHIIQKHRITSITEVMED